MKWYFTVLQRYAQFSGRASRSEFWYFTLFNFIFIYALLFIGLAIGFPYLQVIYGLGVIIPGLAVGARRMHDINKTGWFYIIPFVNIVLACFSGDVGPNQYGDDPLVHPEFGAADYEKPYDATT